MEIRVICEDASSPFFCLSLHVAVKYGASWHGSCEAFGSSVNVVCTSEVAEKGKGKMLRGAP